MLNSDTEYEIFWKTIRELTFTPIVTLPFLSESVNENRLGTKISKTDEETRANYATLNENLMGRIVYQKDIKNNDYYVNSYKRFARMFKIFLSKSSDEALPLSDLVKLPKVYDSFLSDSNVVVYNHMAEYLGFPPIGRNTPSLKVLLETAFWDNNTVDDSVVANYYPYFYSGERAGLYFVEYILLLNVSLMIQGRSLTYLNKAIYGIYDENKLNELVSKIKRSMHSPEIYLTYVDTFFAILFYESAIYYNDKSAFINSFSGKSVGVFDYFYSIITKTVNSIFDADNIHEELIVISWKLFGSNNDFNPNKKDDIKWINKLPVEKIEKASKYLKIIEEYITTSISEAELLLNKILDL